MADTKNTARIWNHGLRKICVCDRRSWAKCPHSWHFNYKARGGPSYRFAVDVQERRHIASKLAVQKLAQTWRDAIDAGTFQRRGALASMPTSPTSSQPDAVTLDTFIERYTARAEPPLSTNDRGCLKVFAAFTLDTQRLGALPIGTFTLDTIEQFFAGLRKEGRSASTRNKYIQAVKAAFRWATEKGYLERDPITTGGTRAPKSLKREKPAKRRRRLVADVLNDKGHIVQEGEERRLLAVAAPHLQRLIIAAIESCCRKGELLALQWRDVNLTSGWLTVRAEEAGARKTGEGRDIPISPRLSPMLVMAQTALRQTLRSAQPDLSDGEIDARLSRCYVFGDESGGKIGNFKRAWETAVLKAHGSTAQWTKQTKALTAESRSALDAIDLHFHDLRHEGASRYLEGGVPLHEVQHMLGHQTAQQTSTYTNAARLRLQASVRRFGVGAGSAPAGISPGCNSLQSPGETDPPPDCNGPTGEAANVTVN